MGRGVAALVFACLVSAVAAAQDVPAPQPRLTAVTVTSATIFTTDDVAWLLNLRTGEPLPAPPEDLAKQLERLYSREGFTAAKVTATLDGGRLALVVDEGRFELIVIEGANPMMTRRLERALEDAGVRAGEPFNEPVVNRAVRRVLAATTGGFSLRDAGLVERAGTRVLRVAVRRREGEFSFHTGTKGREDFFNPVDGLSLPLGFDAVAYDGSGLNYTFIGGFASWKFGRDDAGYSLGVERPLLSNTRLFLGAEIHDLTASDDQWRLGNLEQTIAAAGFRNTFRDYYRRRGVQVHAGARPNPHHEVVVSGRWDRHEPLANVSDFSLFRRDREFRANPLVEDAELGAVVVAYTFDTTPMDTQAAAERYAQHLVDDLFRARRTGFDGFRLDWTSEIAGRSMEGNYDFTRHILHARGGLRLGPHQRLAGRALFGWSSGTLPLERQFAVGGIGTVHAYTFKEAAGSSLALFNAEYALDLHGDWQRGSTNGFRVLLFLDAGRVGEPRRGTDDWLKAAGVGVQVGAVRVEWGFKLDDIPGSGQVIVRLGRSF